MSGYGSGVYGVETYGGAAAETAEQRREARVALALERDTDPLAKFRVLAGTPPAAGVVGFGPLGKSVQVSAELRGGEIWTADFYLAGRLRALPAALEEYV